MSAEARRPQQADPVDVHVGSRIRMKRRMLGINQAELAAQIGLTFQQVQKYESGANRISASKLYAAAVALQTSPAFFFEGFSDPRGETRPDDPGRESRLVQAFLAMPEGIETAEAFARLGSGQVRRHLVALLHHIVDEQ